MPFTELCIYQVKPQKVGEFEALMLEAKEFLEKQKGLLLLRFVKREHHIDMEQIKDGLPPPSICSIGNLIRKKAMEQHKKISTTVIGSR